MDEQSTFNRATQGTYPLGSVFKIVTMAAALESGIFTPSTTYECGYAFTDIPGSYPVRLDLGALPARKGHQRHSDLQRRKCPTQRQIDSRTRADALLRPLVLPYRFNLWTLDKGNQISDMAKAFGLGSGTGIEQVAESKGSIPDPADGLQATSICHRPE